MVKREPTNSSNPKLSKSGNNNPANRNIEKRIVNKSLKTNPPVTSLIINSGPTCNKTNTPNILPIILEIDQSGVVLNKAL